MLIVFRKGDTPKSNEHFNVKLIAQNLKTFETIFNFSGNFDLFCDLLNI